MKFNNGKLWVVPKAITLMLGIFLTIGSQAQTVIKGKVTDAKGQPVPGAAVQIKNINNR